MKTIKISMYFPPNKITEPIMYRLVKDYNLMVNILHADIGLNKVGKLVTDISGNDWDIESGLKFIQDQGIEYKLFTKSIIWKDEECVHCGACTAVCPSGALSMDKNDWSLKYDREKCLVCELCVKACPIKVINVVI